MGELVQHPRLLSRRVLAVVMAGALLVALVALGTSPRSAGAATVPLGPDGPAFYVPPSPLPPGAPGRPHLGPTAHHRTPCCLTPRPTRLVLHHSTAVRDGRDIAVSAMVALPTGTASRQVAGR